MYAVVKIEMYVTAPDLLKGSWYALEQCGHLLRATVALYGEEEYSTAVGVAMFAHEELGRHRILLDEWRKAIQTGQSPSIKEIRKACREHLVKQERGQGSVTFEIENPSDLATAIKTNIEATPGDPKFEAAETVIQEVLDAMVKEGPGKRHKKRFESFYVDLEGSSKGWKRPLEVISQKEANSLLINATNNYAMPRHTFSDAKSIQDPQLAQALVAWSDKPYLPPPIWPEYPS